MTTDVFCLGVFLLVGGLDWMPGEWWLRCFGRWSRETRPPEWGVG